MQENMGICKAVQDDDEPLTFYQDEDGAAFINLSEQGSVLTYADGSPDAWNVRSVQSFSMGMHFIEIEVVKIGDEGFFGIILDLNVLGDYRRRSGWKSGVQYYPGRRHKQWNLEDGVACLKINGEPKERLFHIADGNIVGILVDCDKRLVSFYLDSRFQVRVPWPDDLVTPVYVLVSPDYDRDQFRIRRSTVPSSPSGFEALCECFIHSLAGKTVQRWDVVTVNGRFSTVHFGPDLQGDMQVMFNDVYPEFFPISGDLNIKDTGVNAGRYLTTVVMLMIILSFIACSMCFLCLCTEALASLVSLCNNVAFKAYILFLVLFGSLGFYCLMVRVPSAFWKKKAFTGLCSSCLRPLCVFAVFFSERMSLIYIAHKTIGSLGSKLLRNFMRQMA